MEKDRQIVPQGVPNETANTNLELPYQVDVDPRFQKYFAGIQQVFLYITDDCGLACKQCLYKPWLRRKEEFDVDVAISLLGVLRTMGASKLSILGGEPTRYEQLPAIIEMSKKMGYQYVRIDTNGQFDEVLLKNDKVNQLDELTFSLDGHTDEINDRLRGGGSFGRCVTNIRNAVERGREVDITCCVHRGNVGKDSAGNYLIDAMIEFAAALGVKKINFHPLFRMGVPRDSWAGETDISPNDWQIIYNHVQENIAAKKYGIAVRIPQRFVTKSEFDQNPAYYGYCPVKMGERVLVHPNGRIQTCALMIGANRSMAHYELKDDRIAIQWEDRDNEIELGNFDLEKPTPCTHQIRDFGDLAPLCISFKPDQDEYVWKLLAGQWVIRFRS